MSDGSDRAFGVRPTDDELVALLRADPDQAVRVLERAMIAVQRGLGIYLPGPKVELVSYALGLTSQDPVKGWHWWISARVDPDQPSGPAVDAYDAMCKLRAELERRGVTIGRAP